MLKEKPLLEVEARIKDLLKRMTLEEKIAQLGSVPCKWDFFSQLSLFETGKFSKERAKKILGKGMGQITRLMGGNDSTAASMTARISG